MPRPRNLLLCFDAFGTLFKPRHPIHQQYGDVARAFGLSGFGHDDVGKAFKTAFKEESQKHPNYGKAAGLGPEQWWTNVITNTFQPLTRSSDPLPPGMVRNLLDRFRCGEGYTLFPDVQPLISRLRAAYRANDARVVIGVITNSDTRVPGILTSLGLKVGPLRYGSCRHKRLATAGGYDVDFSVMSYDVGHEKPDTRIFEAAEELLGAVLAHEDAETGQGLNQWRKVYVGDEYDKDVVGALNAGWNAVLLDRESAGQRAESTWMDEKPIGSLDKGFEAAKAVGFSSLEKLAQWLPSRP